MLTLDEWVQELDRLSATSNKLKEAHAEILSQLASLIGVGVAEGHISDDKGQQLLLLLGAAVQHGKHFEESCSLAAQKIFVD